MSLTEEHLAACLETLFLAAMKTQTFRFPNESGVTRVQEFVFGDLRVIIESTVAGLDRTDPMGDHQVEGLFQVREKPRDEGEPSRFQTLAHFTLAMGRREKPFEFVFSNFKFFGDERLFTTLYTFVRLKLD